MQNCDEYKIKKYYSGSIRINCLDYADEISHSTVHRAQSRVTHAALIPFSLCKNGGIRRGGEGSGIRDLLSNRDKSV